jgi:hypothetical protein
VRGSTDGTSVFTDRVRGECGVESNLVYRMGKRGDME